jgi:hypothetical protein
MFECFLLLLQKGAKWIPLVAIPAVLAGIVASICLMLSAIKRIISEWYRPKRRVRPASRERIVQWMAPSGHRRQKGAGSSETLTQQAARVFHLL